MTTPTKCEWPNCNALAQLKVQSRRKDKTGQLKPVTMLTCDKHAGAYFLVSGAPEGHLARMEPLTDDG